jgi:hypothetical protein
MTRPFAHRLMRLERQGRARALPSWIKVDAAMERLRTSARAHVEPALHGHVVPGRDEIKAHTDRTSVDRWCTAHGTCIDWKGARARLQATLTTIATRHAADPPQCLPARSPC